MKQQDEYQDVLESTSYKTMKAVRVHEYGGVDVLKYEDAPRPIIHPDEVLIKVHYSSVNPVDRKIRQGDRKDPKRKLPFIPGWDVSGTVEETGALVTEFKKGDIVFARPDPSKDGAYAEYIAVAGFELAIAPSRISLKEAAGVPLAAQTAWSGLFEHGKLRKGQSILIHGASGGVGMFAVQFAKIAGAHVIATTSARNKDLVRSLGADVTIDYKSEDFTKIDKVDMVFDTIGGETQAKSYGVINPGGTLVSTVGADEQEGAKRSITAKGFMMISNGSRLAAIAGLIEKGMVKVIIEKEFPLSEIKAAHELSQSGKSTGKIILKIAAR